MSRSVKAKQTALNIRMSENKKSRDKPRGQSGTHRLKQLNPESETVAEKFIIKPQKSGWLSRLLRK